MKSGMIFLFSLFALTSGIADAKAEVDSHVADSTDKIVLQAKSAQTYMCQDGKTVMAQYFNSTENSISIVKLTLDSGTRFLPAVVSGSGSRYTDERDIEWWIKGDEASLDYDLNSDDKTRETTCEVKK